VNVAPRWVTEAQKIITTQRLYVQRRQNFALKAIADLVTIPIYSYPEWISIVRATTTVARPEWTAIRFYV
jgi:hypothetical protein